MTANSRFKEQKRKIERLEAISKGFTPPEPEPPALAYEDAKPDGDFGMYFNSDIAGLSFLETLGKGMGSRGEVTDSSRLLSSLDFQMSNFLKFGVIRGSEDSASV